VNPLTFNRAFNFPFRLKANQPSSNNKPSLTLLADNRAAVAGFPLAAQPYDSAAAGTTRIQAA